MRVRVEFVVHSLISWNQSKFLQTLIRSRRFEESIATFERGLGELRIEEQISKDVAAQEADDDSEYDFSDQDFTDEVEANLKAKEGLGKAHNIPFMPKEEELSDDELEKYLEERYKSSSKYVVYAKDEFESKGSGDKNSLLPSVDGPVI